MHPIHRARRLPYYVVPALLVVAITAAFAFRPLSGAVQDAERPFRVLVVNDDGIDSPGLSALVRELARTAEVWVCAPDGNRSGASMSSDGWGRPMTIAEHEIEGAQRACAIGGRPVDATHFGLLGFGEGQLEFDMVVSGINDGSNVGNLSHYSGTVGAAMTAAHLGLPAVAVSQGREIEGFDFTAGFAARFVQTLRERGARPGIVYSINVPKGAADAIRGVTPARMGGEYFRIVRYRELEGRDGEKLCRGLVRMTTDGPEGSDTVAFFDDHITITPLRFDWTDDETLAELEGWELGIE